MGTSDGAGLIRQGSLAAMPITAVPDTRTLSLQENDPASSNRMADLTGKILQGSLYSGAAAGVTFVLGFIRSVLLARLLLPEHFGAVALAAFFCGLAANLHSLGMNKAMIHHQGGEDAFKATYFSVAVGLNGLKVVLLLAAAPYLQRLYPHIPALGQVVVASALISGLSALCLLQETLLRKELAFDALARTEVAASVAMTLMAPFCAWLGWGVWALVAESASQVLTRCVCVWGLYRRWPPRFGWTQEAGELFWRFGKSFWIRANLSYLLSTFDDSWVGTALGQTALGYYTTAYAFSQSPRRVLGHPLVTVFEPAFACLQRDRQQLSAAFFWATYLMLRLGFLGAGLFALLMPEFIRLVIGDKWLPMLWAFRLLLVYQALDGLALLVSNLLSAVGKPEVLRHATIAQTLFFIPTVILGAYLAGIHGVALAVNGMLLVGIGYMYRPLRDTVDVSLCRLAGWPLVALTAAIGIGLAVEGGVSMSLWHMLGLKIGVFVLVFGGCLAFAEWQDDVRGVRRVLDLLQPQKRGEI